MLHYKQYNPNNLPSQTTLVLLHGLCESLEFWQEVVTALQDKMPIICIDLPGFGKSPLTENIVSVAAIADELNQVLEFCGVEKCVMIGHSLGGYVSLAFAEKYANKLQGVGLCNSTAFADTEEKKDRRNKLIESIQQNGTRPFISTFFQGLFNPANVAMYETQIQALQEQAQSIAPETLICITAILRDRPNYIPVIQSLTMPVLFIVGKQDMVLPLEQHEKMFLYTQNMVLRLQDTVGHLSVLEAPQDTILTINRFWEVCHGKSYVLS
jgi:pimeloyl-ACP methyl ester carboxylesterase